MAQIYSGFYIRSHSGSLPKRPCTTSCIMWSHDTTVIGYIYISHRVHIYFWLKTTDFIDVCTLVYSGGSKGGASPTAQNLLNFMQFFGKFWQYRRLAPPPGLFALNRLDSRSRSTGKKGDRHVRPSVKPCC